MLPLIASLFSSAAGSSNAPAVGIVAPPPDNTALYAVGILAGVAVIGGLIYFAVRE